MGNRLSVRAPFLSKHKDFAVGLNQLGMRNIGEQLFGALLPGLNNVSSRIRYYAFYCWLFNHYYVGKEKVEEKPYQKFLRKTELLLALINHDRMGIPGVTYANNEVAKGLPVFSLIEGTEGKTRYWSYQWGIFGQYYVQSMVDMGLIHSIPSKEGKASSMYNSTEKGKELGNIFEQSIGSAQSKAFWSIIQRNEVSRAELEQMREPFNMLLPSPITTERQFLIDLLTGADYPNEEVPTHYRAETIMYVLEWIEQHHPKTIKDMEFVEYIYKRFLDEDAPAPSLWGWYAYAVNEDWQYQSSKVLTALLHDYLGKAGYPWLHTDTVVEDMANEVCKNFGLAPDTILGEVINLFSTDVPQDMDKVSVAIASLLHNYRINKNTTKNLEPLKMAFHNLTNDNFFTFMGKVERLESATLMDFLRHFIKEEIIYRHYKEAFRKQKMTKIATQKFAMESGCIRYLSDIDYSHSSPRLATLFGFLEDLGVIQDKKLTAEGKRLLNTLRNDFEK